MKCVTCHEETKWSKCERCGSLFNPQCFYEFEDDSQCLRLADDSGYCEKHGTH